MSEFKEFIRINPRFRNGIVTLGILICLILAGIFWLKQQKPNPDLFVNLSDYQEVVDSLKQQSIAEKGRQKAYFNKPFNPNFISDYKGYQLGMSTQQLDKLYAFRKADKWIRSTKEFQQVTGIPDTLLDKIAPLFKFPDFGKNKKSKSFKKRNISKSWEQKKDLNTVTTSELVEIIKFPEFVANRIISYRKEIGGFQIDAQLKDIKGLYPKQAEKILSLYTVKTKKEIVRISVNTATAAELIQIPYIDFDLALAIKDYIRDHGDVVNFYEFDKIEGFPTEKN